jgi:predicted XRE-type DNA-binding protein
MSYPNKNQIEAIMNDIEKLRKKNKIAKLSPLPKNAPPIDKWKFKISQKIAEFKTMRGLTLKEMSALLKTDQANVSRIINGRIEKVTMDKLLQYFEIVIIASKNKKMAEKYHLTADKFFDLNEIQFA